MQSRGLAWSGILVQHPDILRSGLFASSICRGAGGAFLPKLCTDKPVTIHDCYIPSLLGIPTLSTAPLHAGCVNPICTLLHDFALQNLRLRRLQVRTHEVLEKLDSQETTEQ